MPEIKDGLTAAEAAKLLRTEILDVDDAAALLGILSNSLEYAAYRGRINYIQYGAKKLFTRTDLLDYAARRGRGRESKVLDGQAFVVKPSPVGNKKP